MFGIGLLVPFLTVIFTPSSGDVSDASGVVFSILERLWQYVGDSRLSIDILALVIVSVFGLKFLITVLSAYIITNFSQNQRTKIGKRLLTIFLSMDFLEYQKRTEADGLYEIQTVSAVFFQCLQVLMKSLSEMLTLIVLITLMFFLQPLLSLFFVVSLLALGGAFGLVTKNYAALLGKSRNQAESKIIDLCQNAFSGFKEIRLLNKFDFYVDRVAAQLAVSGRINRTLAILAVLPKQFLEFAAIASVLTIFVLREWIGFSVEYFVEIATVFAVIAIRILPLVSSLVVNFNSINSFRDGIDRIYESIKTMERGDSRSIYKKPVWPFGVVKHISLKNVTYSYPGSKRLTLRGVNLTLEKGQIIGIVGASGCGKTTLLNIVCGFLKPDGGSVDIEFAKGGDIRPSVGYLSASPAIFNGSVSDNIGLGEKQLVGNERYVSHIFCGLGLDHVLGKMPNCLEMDLGQFGSKISAGQQQRVALARSLFHGVSVLVMDEALNAIDEDTEKSVFQFLREHKDFGCALIVTHRESTLRFCDKKMIMRNGELHPFDSNNSMTP